MQRDGRSRLRLPKSLLDVFNWRYPSSTHVALKSTQPPTEMSTKNLPGGKWRPARKAHIFTAICKSTFQKIWEPRCFRALWAFTACYRDSFTLYFYLIAVWDIVAHNRLCRNVATCQQSGLRVCLSWCMGRGSLGLNGHCFREIETNGGETWSTLYSISPIVTTGNWFQLPGPSSPLESLNGRHNNLITTHKLIRPAESSGGFVFQLVTLNYGFILQNWKGELSGI
jgi:hypothetical protein